MLNCQYLMGQILPPPLEITRLLLLYCIPLALPSPCRVIPIPEGLRVLLSRVASEVRVSMDSH